jgi:hypothetical protein
VKLLNATPQPVSLCKCVSVSKECGTLLAEVEDEQEAFQDAKDASDAGLQAECANFRVNRAHMPDRCKRVTAQYDKLKGECTQYYIQNGVFAPKPSYSIPSKCKIFKESDFTSTAQ